MSVSVITLSASAGACKLTFPFPDIVTLGSIVSSALAVKPTPDSTDNVNNPIINFLLLMATPSFFATAFFIFLFYHSFLLFAYLKLNPYFVFCTTLAIVFKKIVLFIIGLMSNN
ncbi:hypothetical protein [Lactococcus petauri]